MVEVRSIRDTVASPRRARCGFGEAFGCGELQERWAACRPRRGARERENGGAGIMIGVQGRVRGPDEGEFVWHEISTRVNHVGNDDPRLILPITPEQRKAESATPQKKASPRKPAAAVPDDGQGSLF